MLVAQIVKVGIVGVVRRSDGVKVKLLHQHHVLFHLLAGDSLAVFWAVIVTIDADHFHRNAIHKELACFVDRDRAKADVDTCRVDKFSLAIDQ